jgi:hypothetical protein
MLSSGDCAPDEKGLLNCQIACWRQDTEKIYRAWTPHTERGRSGHRRSDIFLDLFLQNAFFEEGKLPDLLKWHG